VDSSNNATVLAMAWLIHSSTSPSLRQRESRATFKTPMDFRWIYVNDHAQTNFTGAVGGNTLTGLPTVANDSCASPSPVNT